MQDSAFPLVRKEDLHRYQFINYEILETETEIENRKKLLEEAMLLGNGEKQKVKLFLETTVGIIIVETTVWDTTDSFIELKNATDIPICCIREVII